VPRLTNHDLIALRQIAEPMRRVQPADGVWERVRIDRALHETFVGTAGGDVAAVSRPDVQGQLTGPGAVVIHRLLGLDEGCVHLRHVAGICVA
jgi:hypothetical protein